MMSLHADGDADGFTQASSVIPVVRSSDNELGMPTLELVPLKTSAPPNSPAEVQLVFVTVPLLPCPEASLTVVPEPSSNEYEATRVAVAPAGVMAVAGFEASPMFPAPSIARTWYV